MPDPSAQAVEALADALERTCAPWLALQADEVARVAAASSGSDAPLPQALYAAAVLEVRRRRADRPPAREASGRVEAGLLDALQQLDDERRRAVLLFLLGGSVDRVARRLGWDPRTTEGRIMDGLAELRRGLRGEGAS